MVRLGRRRVIRGVEVRALRPGADESSLFAKMYGALDLLAAYAPRSLVLLRRNARVFVAGREGPSGEWWRELGVVRLSKSYVADEGTHPVHVAATLVHEVAHAWLEGRGIAYTGDKRRRIEAMCLRAQARFAMRIPGGRELADFYADVARRLRAGSDEEWSDAAFREQRINRLVALNAPKWLLRAIGIDDKELVAAIEDSAK